MKRTAHLIPVLGTLSVTLAQAGNDVNVTRDKPLNIIYIMTDDHAQQTLVAMTNVITVPQIHFYGADINSWELFDLKKDPTEMHNLYGNEKYADRVVTLKAELDALQKQYDVKESDY